MITGIITWASHRETKLKIALRFFFFSSFSHKSPSGPKNACAGVLSLMGVCLQGSDIYLVADFSRFPNKNTTFRSGTSKNELLRNTQQFR